MKFSEMKYERCDIDQFNEKMREITKSLKEANSYEEAKIAFLAADKLKRDVQTNIILCSVRHSINTKDEFYEKEQEFWDNESPKLNEESQNFTMALLENKFRKEFEKEYGNVFFINAEISLKTFKPEIVEDLQKENVLCNEYNKLIASAQIEFEGKTYTISQLAPFTSNADDDVRLKAVMAVGNWMTSHQEELDRIYDDLVHIRDTMAKKLGYENYIELGYYRMGRNCYDEKMIDKFRENVRNYVVPIANECYKKQAERLNVAYPLQYHNCVLEFRSGNPKPQGSSKDILQVGKEFYDWLSPETSKFFRMMLDNDLLDVESTEGKQAGGYCTDLGNYNMPFIFANFNGTQHDVEVVTHEAGHAFAAYMNMDRIPYETMWPSMEACEVHSMSMEFFGEKFADAFFGKDARKFVYSHLAGALTFIPYGTLVDHFQHEVYRHPEYTPSQRHQVWLDLESLYQPWISFDNKIPFFSNGHYWQRQQHIYNSPFYYIDYCLAQTVSLEFWKMLQEDKDNAWNHYMAYTKLGGTKTFTDLLKSADLTSPFEQDSLKSICEKAEDYLKNFDLTGIR